MNKRDTHAFVNQLLVYTLVMICISSGVGVGIVWLRHQISVTANRNKQLQARIAEVERHLAETVTEVERAQSPDMLKLRNAEWKLGFAIPARERIVEVTDAVNLRLAAKRNRELFTDLAPKVTPVVFYAGSTR